MYLQYPTFEGRQKTIINTCDKIITKRDDLGLGIIDGKRGGEVDEGSGEKVQASTIHCHPNSTINHHTENRSVGGLNRMGEPNKRASSGKKGE